MSGGEKELFNAITDTKVHAVIDTGDGQPNAAVDFGGNDSVTGGPQGRNTLDMPEMKLLDSPENKGGMSAGNAVAHETLEAYASAQGKKFDDAHDYAAKYFGEFQCAGSCSPCTATSSRPWLPDDEKTRTLQYLVAHRRRLVDDRTRISNRLTSLLKGEPITRTLKAHT